MNRTRLEKCMKGLNKTYGRQLAGSNHETQREKGEDQYDLHGVDECEIKSGIIIKAMKVK